MRITIGPGLRSQGRRDLGMWQMVKDLCFRELPFNLSITRLQSRIGKMRNVPDFKMLKFPLVRQEEAKATESSEV